MNITYVGFSEWIFLGIDTRLGTMVNLEKVITTLFEDLIGMGCMQRRGRVGLATDGCTLGCPRKKFVCASSSIDLWFSPSPIASMPNLIAILCVLVPPAFGSW